MQNFSANRVLAILNKEVAVFIALRGSWVILSTITLLNGLAGWWAMHQEPVVNAALQMIFYFLSGTTMISSVLYGMRAIAEEKSKNTFDLLLTSPVSEMEIMAGKLLSLFLIVFIQILLSSPIIVSTILLGDGSWGQAISGYLGLLFLSMASLSVSLFYSSLTSNQLVAASMAGANIVLFLLFGFFSPYLDLPVKSILRQFSFYIRFSEFEKGVISLKNCAFFLSISLFYLYLSVNSISSRSWRGK